MTITRVGPNQKYSAGWEAAFSSKGSGGKGPAKATSTAKKAAPSKKAAAKKPKKAKR